MAGDVHISRELLAQATQCRRGHACVDATTRDMCEATGADGPCVTFIRRKGNEACPYLLAFGHGHVCRCPVRRHLYVSAGL